MNFCLMGGLLFFCFAPLLVYRLVLVFLVHVGNFDLHLTSYGPYLFYKCITFVVSTIILLYHMYGGCGLRKDGLVRVVGTYLW